MMKNGKVQGEDTEDGGLKWNNAGQDLGYTYPAVALIYEVMECNINI